MILPLCTRERNLVLGANTQMMIVHRGMVVRTIGYIRTCKAKIQHLSLSTLKKIGKVGQSNVKRTQKTPTK